MKIVFMSDVHVGSGFAPLPPRFTFKSGDNYIEPHSAYSDFVTRLLYEKLEQAAKTARGGVLVVLGDVVNGVKHGEDNIIPRVGDQVDAAIMLLRDAVSILDASAVVLVDGTAAHDGDVGGAIASALDAVTVGHGLINIGGVVIDAAHHGGNISDMPHIGANTFRAYVARYVVTCSVNGITVPDVVARGHVHKHAVEYVTIGARVVTGIVVPSWCGLTPYARNVTRSTPIVAHGLVVYDTDTRAATPFVSVYDTRKRVEIS